MTSQLLQPTTGGPSVTVTMSPDVLFQDLEGEAVLLNLANEKYYGLDDVGTRMWQALEEHGHVETVVLRMLAEYEVDESTLRKDLADLIGKLSETGLVSVTE